MPAPQNKGRSAGLCPLRRIRCFFAPPAGTEGRKAPRPVVCPPHPLFLSSRARPHARPKGSGLHHLHRPSPLRPLAPHRASSAHAHPPAPSLLLTRPPVGRPKGRGLHHLPLASSAPAPPLPPRRSSPVSRLRASPSSRPSAPHTLIFSITWIFFPLKEFSFLETIRFLCNYVSVVVFYLNFFRRHAMKSLLCFFLGLAFLPISASAIEHLPPPLTPFK